MSSIVPRAALSILLGAYAPAVHRSAHAQAGPPATVTQPYQAFWSARAKNYWLYWLDTSSGKLRACDWKQDTTDLSGVGSMNCVAYDPSIPSTGPCAKPSAKQLIVPTNPENNSVAILQTDTGCVSVCYFLAPATAPAGEIACTVPAIPGPASTPTTPTPPVATAP